MAAPSFASAGAGVSGTSASIAVPYPATVNANDILIVHLLASGPTVTGVSMPAGWTQVGSPVLYTHGLHVAYWKLATGSESGTLAVTFTGGNYSSGVSGRMYSFLNAHRTAPISGYGSDTATGSAIADRTVTTASANYLAVNLVGLGDSLSIGPFTGMSGGTWAEAVAEYKIISGSGRTLQLQTAAMPTAATINGGTVAVGTSNQWSVLGFALVKGPAVDVGQAQTTSTAQTITPVKTVSGLHATLGQPSETGLAQAFTAVLTPPPDTNLYIAVDFGSGYELLDDRVASLRIVRGRQTNLDVVEAGTLEVLLRNGDGELDPSNAASSLYGRILPLLPARVLRIKDGHTYELFRGPVERWQPDWVPPNHQDMEMAASDSSDILANHTIVSDKATLTTNLAGSNNDLVFTAKDAGGQGDNITVEYVVTGTGTALDTGINEPLQGGAITTVQYVPKTGGYTRPISGGGQKVGGGGDAVLLTASISGSDITVTVATDGSGNPTSTASQILAALQADAEASALVDVALATGNTGAGVVTAMTKTNLAGGKWPEELTGARINRVLDLIGWPSDQRAIDAGQSFVVAEGPSVKDNTSAFSHCKDVADSELGAFFFTGADVATFHDGAHRPTSSRSTTSQATFSDDGTGFSFTAISPSFDKDRIVNSASVVTGVENASPQTSDDVYSQDGTGSAPAGATNIPPGGFRKRDITRQTRLAHDGDALAQAQGIVAALAYPLYRFDSITTLQPLPDDGGPPLGPAPVLSQTAYGSGAYGSGAYGGEVPFTFSYQWQDSVDGTTWTDIGGATSQDYTIPKAEAGKYLRCEVTATDAGGATTVSTGPSQLVEFTDENGRWAAAVMALEIGDLITVRTTPPGTTSTTSFDAYVEGLEDYVEPGLPWQRTIRLSAKSQALVPTGGGGGGGGVGAMLNAAGGVLILDDPVEGVIN